MNARLGIRAFNLASWLGFRIIRVSKHQLAHTALSPELAKETEITCNTDQYPDNDLRRIFLNNTAKNLHKWHHYFEIYDQWFSGFRDVSNLRILEIGVYRGGSLRLWRQYFHPEAVIVGIDIDLGCKAYEDSRQKIFVEIGDQADLSFLAHVIEKFGPFDIIIDDGGHTSSQQTISFNHLYANALNNGGVYLIEDLHTNYWSKFRDAPQSFIDFAKSLVDRLHEPYFDNFDETRFREGDRGQRRSMNVSIFCANTRSISFYDSIVVFEKRRKLMPSAEIR